MMMMMMMMMIIVIVVMISSVSGITVLKYTAKTSGWQKTIIRHQNRIYFTTEQTEAYIFYILIVRDRTHL